MARQCLSVMGGVPRPHGRPPGGTRQVPRCAAASRRSFAKTTLLASGIDAKEQCSINQHCVGLKAGIHAASELWKQCEVEEEWDFLLIDVANAFNELNQMAMLWTIWHEWPSGARYAFNCYRPWATLMIHDRGGTVLALYSKECVTQGPPLPCLGMEWG